MRSWVNEETKWKLGNISAKKKTPYIYIYIYMVVKEFQDYEQNKIHVNIDI